MKTRDQQAFTLDKVLGEQGAEEALWQLNGHCDRTGESKDAPIFFFERLRIQQFQYSEVGQVYQIV